MTGRKRPQLRAAGWHTEMGMLAALWDGLAAQWAAGAPRCHPDGSPYPADVHLANLARIGAYVDSLRLPDSGDWMDKVTILMRMVRDAGKQGLRVEEIRALVDLRALLVRRGRATEVRWLAAAAADVNRFHAESVTRT